MNKQINALKALLLGSTASVICVLDTEMSFAQTEEVAVDRIVVTARKREESLQDVPVVVSVFDKETMESKGINSIDDLAQITPGLLTEASGTSSNLGVIALRGVSTGAINVASDQAVAINVDGIQIESVLGLRAGQIDLQQAEILKGPQTLFFGKNSPGGVISLKTADPTDEFFLQGRGGYEFGAEEKFGELIISGPLTDTLSARAVVYYTDVEGWIDNTEPTGIDDVIPSYDEVITRGTLRWEPTDAFTATAKLTYSDRSSDKRSWYQKVNCDIPANTTSDCTLDHRAAFTPPVDLLGRYGGQQPFDDTTAWFASLNMDYRLSDNLTVSSVTGYYDIEQDYFDSVFERGAGDVVALGVDPGTGAPIFFPNEALVASNDKVDSISQELRLTSDFDGPLNFMIGGFYDNREVSTDIVVQLAVIGVPASKQGVMSESFSVFGQLIYDVTDQLELSGGLRYTDESKRYEGVIFEPIVDAASGTVLAPAGSPIIPADDRFQADNVSPEATLTWRPRDNVTLFASYKQGFKSGSFDTSATANLPLAILNGAFDIRFENEDVEGFEGGFKTTWAGGQLTFNGAGYYFDYTNLQLTSFDPITISTRVINAGGATVSGFEAEFQYRPANVGGLSVNGALAYNRARYSEFVTDCNQTLLVTGACPLPNDQVDLAGEPLTIAPDFTASLGFTYDGFINEKFGYRFGSSLNYSSEYFTDPRNEPISEQDGFATLYANFGIYGANDKWSLDFIGRNLTNELFVIQSTNQPFTNLGVPGARQDIVSVVNRGREVIIQLTLRL